MFPLTEESTLEEYLQEATEGNYSSQLLEIRKELWEKLDGIPFYVQTLSPAEFIHLEQALNLETLLTNKIEDFAGIGWNKSVLGYSAEPCSSATLINSCIDTKIASRGSCLVEDSYLLSESNIGNGSIVSNVVASIPIYLVGNLVLHQLPLNGDDGDVQFVTRIYGVDDNPKDSIDFGTYCNIKWKQWLTVIPRIEEHLWKGISHKERTLWNARLFPVCKDRDESLRLVLWLQCPSTVSDQIFDQWINTRRVSLEDCIGLTNRIQILKDQTKIENTVRRKKFLQFIDEERDISEFTNVLGSDPVRIASNLTYVEDEIGRSKDPHYRMRGYRIVAELLKIFRFDPLKEVQAAAAVENFEVSNESFSWSIFEDKLFVSCLLVQSHPILTSKYDNNDLNMDRLRLALHVVQIFGGWSDTPPFSIEKGGHLIVPLNSTADSQSLP